MTDMNTMPPRFGSAPPHRAATATAGQETLYTIDGASFRVEDRTLLHPLTLTLSSRCVYGVLGHNGSGKSTLVKLLARQQQPTAGAIHLQGQALGEWDSRALARKVAYLPQQLPSADGMTVRELVALGRYPWHGALGRFSAIDTSKVEDALRLTDVARFADRSVDSLSGGERQRVWIAMLIAQDSDCLLLDEPISALDIGHQIDVLKLIKDLSVERGLGVVVVLHDINMAARFCDRLVALKAGKVVAQGSPEELMKPEVLSQIYGIPMGALAHPGGDGHIGFAY